MTGQWRLNAGHSLARKYGREKGNTAFKTRIALVEHDYGFERYAPAMLMLK